MSLRNWITAGITVCVIAPLTGLAMTGKTVSYEVDGGAYEGYYVSSGDEAPLGKR